MTAIRQAARTSWLCASNAVEHALRKGTICASAAMRVVWWCAPSTGRRKHTVIVGYDTATTGTFTVTLGSAASNAYAGITPLDSAHSEQISPKPPFLV